VAKIKDKPKELPKDAFQSKGQELAEQLGKRFENQRRNVYIGLGVVAGVIALIVGFTMYRNNKAEKAYDALGKAIKVGTAQVSATPLPDAAGPVFTNETERSKKAIEEFQNVTGYGDPTGAIARYFVATNQLKVDRAQGLSQLQQLAGDPNPNVAVLSKFALAQAYEADAKYDDAAKFYSQLASANNDIITPDTANLRLAHVYDKQGKQNEAVELLFNLVKAARERKNKDGKPPEQSSAAREAAQELQRLNPKRFGELPKEPEAA
jgi:tetratricopeptide (TPR) repeat protein